MSSLHVVGSFRAREREKAFSRSKDRNCVQRQGEAGTSGCTSIEMQMRRSLETLTATRLRVAFLCPFLRSPSFRLFIGQQDYNTITIATSREGSSSIRGKENLLRKKLEGTKKKTDDA